MEQHSLIALIVILLCQLPPPVAVSLPELGVPETQHVTSHLTQSLSIHLIFCIL